MEKYSNKNKHFIQIIFTPIQILYIFPRIQFFLYFSSSFSYLDFQFSKFSVFSGKTTIFTRYLQTAMKISLNYRMPVRFSPEFPQKFLQISIQENFCLSISKRDFFSVQMTRDFHYDWGWFSINKKKGRKKLQGKYPSFWQGNFPIDVGLVARDMRNIFFLSSQFVS